MSYFYFQTKTLVIYINNCRCSIYHKKIQITVLQGYLLAFLVLMSKENNISTIFYNFCSIVKKITGCLHDEAFSQHAIIKNLILVFFFKSLHQTTI